MMIMFSFHLFFIFFIFYEFFNFRFYGLFSYFVVFQLKLNHLLFYLPMFELNRIMFDPIV